MAGLTFLRVVGNDELARQEKEAADRALQERQNQPVILGLTGKRAAAPGACFEANIDGGGWSKANVTSGEILDAATGEVELTLSSTPSTSVAIRYMPGSTGNYTSGTITQANFRAGALYFTGEEYASGEPNSGDDLANLGWLVAGSNQALTLVL